MAVTFINWHDSSRPELKQRQDGNWGVDTNQPISDFVVCTLTVLERDCV